tara:strand:- start:255 stop:467 length:213 start_codon:yes stop_codon:yes gene_type:complete
MNQQEKAQRYDWLLNQYKTIERQISMVPKLPLEETLQDINSREYTSKNQEIVNQLQYQLRMIDEEVKRLF